MKPPFPPLSELQTLFWRLVSAPEGVAAGAAELRRTGALATTDLSFLVPPDARLGPVERLDIYADMYFYRLRDALAEDFPRVAARLGSARWHNLVTDYLLAQPPSHFSLRELGRALPDFLAGHALAGELRAIADLARLEWARVDVFDESDAQALSREALLERGGAAPARARFALVPAARLLVLDPDALRLWRRAGAGDAAADAPAAGRGACDMLVWRRGFAVHHRSLEPDEAGCLRALAAGGATLECLGELLLEARPDAADEEVTARLASLLEGLARDALLIEAPG